MNSEDRKFILTSCHPVILVGGYAGLALYTGFSTPFSVVMSESMQTQHPFRIGCIDTGDVVLVRSLEKAETSPTSIDQDGYKTFGDYDRSSSTREGTATTLSSTAP